MGRSSVIEDADAPIKFRLYAMPMIDGDYDRGGAYWGSGSLKHGWMYHAHSDGPNEMFLRARDRAEARAQVRDTFNQATFYR
jgi:hypothetical protein